MKRLYTTMFAFCTLMMACTSDYPTAFNPSDSSADNSSLAQLTITFTQFTETSSSGSRANEETDPSKETGTDLENKVSTAMVILGKATDNIEQPIDIYNSYLIKDLQPVGTSKTQWKGTIKVDPGTYRIIVIANPIDNIEEKLDIKPNTSWSKLVHSFINTDRYDYLSQIWRDNQFMMTNYFDGAIKDHNIEVLEKRENYATVQVQRVCARFDYQATYSDNCYKPTEVKNKNNRFIFNNKDISPAITLTHIAPVNMSNQFHLLKLISPDETGYTITPHDIETKSNYVVDSDWEAKRGFFNQTLPDVELTKHFFFSTESNATINYTKLPTDQAEFRRLFYASENTLPGVHKQINKLSTGLVFKGYIKFMNQDGQTVVDLPETIYSHKTEERTTTIYTSTKEVLEQLKKEQLIAESVTEKDVNDAFWAEHQVKKFTKQKDGTYPVWYTYWNRHNNNHENNSMGIMEFAVVRNNVYKLKVNSISDLGFPEEPIGPDPWKPDGNTPDESPYQMDVEVKVAEWVERKYEVEI